MNALWRRFGFGLLVVALSGAFVGCGDDDDTVIPEDGGAGSGGAKAGAGGAKAGSGGAKAGAGGARAGSGGSGGSGGSAAMCTNEANLSAECVSCVQNEVEDCGTACVALLNCTAKKCASATTSAETRTCVSSCCVNEATAAVAISGGEAAVGAAQGAQRNECASICAGEMDAGL